MDELAPEAEAGAVDPAADVHALKRFGVLRLEPGDTLVYMYPDYLNEGRRKHLKEALADVFPGTRCVVLDGGASFAVMRGVLTAGDGSAG